ncbi:hypothetical protein T06_10780 [Trichinella sp. T6]|nr:hypothetical protein T06_10780 [Trichinella sp. T6]
MIRITPECNALNANARPTENEFQNFEFHFKSLLQKEINAIRSNSRPYLIFDSSVQQASKYCSIECALRFILPIFRQLGSKLSSIRKQ